MGHQVERRPRVANVGVAQTLAEVDARDGVAGVRGWVRTQLAATVRVYTAPVEGGRMRVQSGADINTSANVPATFTVAAPAGFVSVEYVSGAGGTSDNPDVFLQVS